MTLASLRARLLARELSPREAVQHYLDRIEALDGAVNCYITVRAEEALAEAAALERSGERGLLHGVPVAVKDVIDVAGTRTTAASKVTAGRPPAERDAAVIERLRAAGAIVLGKLNTHEFAFGARTDSKAYGPAHNPWDLDRVPGGSSGGSGACAGADLAAGTLGTDTAGSIRIPAAFNGVSGLRPSLGRVPNRGVTWVSWSFDTIGPVARSAEDCALLLEAIAGHDPLDATTVEAPVPPYSRLLDGGVRGLRIGMVGQLFDRGLDTRIAAVVEEAVGELRALGARVERIDDIPRFEQAGTVQQMIMLPEAASFHMESLRTKLADYGDDVRARLLAAVFFPSTVVVTGQRARRAIYEELRRVFERYDLLVAPTMPTLPPRIDQHTVEVNGEVVPYRLPLIRFNSPWSLIGSPALSIPCGFVDGMPIGMALVGPRLAEPMVLQAAHAFQQATDWHERRPELLASGVRS